MYLCHKLFCVQMNVFIHTFVHALVLLCAGESALLKLVYEDEVQAADLGMQNLQANPSVWRYRPRITVDQFFREFHLQVESRAGRKDDHPVLRLFKAEVQSEPVFFRAWCDRCNTEEKKGYLGLSL